MLKPPATMSPGSVRAAVCLAFTVICALWLISCCAMLVSGAGGGGGGGGGAESASGAGSPSSVAAAAASAASTRAELGRGTWTLLHRAAAQFPASPTAAERARMVAWLEAFAAVYPCADCAAHYAAMLAATPVDASSGPALAAWLCGRHNEVNARLGKPPFPCTPQALQERWGGCGCAEGGEEAGTGAGTGSGGVAGVPPLPAPPAPAAASGERTRAGRVRRGAALPPPLSH